MALDRLDTIGKTENDIKTRQHQIVDLDRMTLNMSNTHVFRPRWKANSQEQWKLMTCTLHDITMKTKNKEGSAAVAEASKFSKITTFKI